MDKVRVAERISENMREGERQWKAQTGMARRCRE
jgi:hypothetical protein